MFFSPDLFKNVMFALIIPMTDAAMTDGYFLVYKVFFECGVSFHPPPTL